MTELTQLDMRRKIALVAIAVAAIVFISLGLPGQKEKADRSTASAPSAPAAQPAAAQASTDPKSFQGFIIYQDKPLVNHYAPSGYMPDGKCIQMDDAWTDNCKEGRSCIRVVFDGACAAKNQNWGGVYWLDPANNWGDHKGGFNLTGAQKLVFWTRGEKGDENIAVFKVGGVSGEFPDSDSAEIGPVTLTKDWRQYTIDLKGKDLSHIIGGFAWVASAQANPQAATFYLDDIHFE